MAMAIQFCRNGLSRHLDASGGWIRNGCMEAALRLCGGRPAATRFLARRGARSAPLEKAALPDDHPLPLGHGLGPVARLTVGLHP